jgi:hypothetical protein
MIRRAVKEQLSPGLLVIAARTGFTRSEILRLSLREFFETVRVFIPRE